MNPHKDHETSLLAAFSSAYGHRRLIAEMAKREVLGRYRGSMMGLAWSFFNPLLMLGVYTFFFSFVFKSRWGVAQEEGHADFAVILFAGLIVQGLFAECINRAPALVTNNVNYVKKVIFPLEILPWIALGSAVFHMAISIFVLLSLQLMITGAIPWTVVFFPILLLPFALLTLGLTWLLAATGVFLRDVGQITGMITTILLFVSPVFYPISRLPGKVQALVMLNPLTFIIEESRKVLLYGQVPDFRGFVVYSAASLLIAWMGFWWFQKTRKGFSDVL